MLLRKKGDLKKWVQDVGIDKRGISMEEKIVMIVNKMADYLSISQMKKLQEVLLQTFSENTIQKEEISNNEYLRLFLDAKRIEGCSERTIQYYNVTVVRMLQKIETPVRKISTEEIRKYLVDYQKINDCSKVTVDNVRRNISSFFSWLEEEDYILKSPMKRIHKIKTKQPVKEIISDEAIELLRDHCQCPRDLAMIDLLYSTGIRVGELVNLNISDVDFEARECVVFGKGDKERNFVNLLPDLSVINLCEEKDNYTAHGVFSTYQTMMNCIDSIHDENGKLFTCGHFDLVICDEAHRSIYNKYRDIFSYFDAPLVGLTATPNDEIDKNTYEIFELENGVPTYGYELAQAVKDGYLVDFVSVETTLKFIDQGIVYDELSEEEKEEYESKFIDENGELPESINSSALNDWVFNEDTIKEVLHIFMTNGIKVDYGNKIGKSIIFAKNHDHAEKIYEVFGKEYPHLVGYAKVIDNYLNYAQSAIDEFSDPKKMPQIAISVDMLDTGIDVPEVVNLVFFKKVMSKAKFWQMIGRGTRLCPGLLDGEDKEKFYIFDFCGNFEFFRMNKGRPTANMIALQGAIFQLEFEIAYKLQDIAYQTERLIAYRNTLVEHMASKVKELNRENFAVRQHLKYVDTYANEKNYTALTYEDTLVVREELSPLIEPENDNATALRFDALMYGIELAYLIGKKYSRGMHDLISKVSALSSVSNIPEIMVQADLINQILHTDYLDNAGINEFEYIRENLRDLMKYIPKGPKVIYETNFDDEILSMDWKESELENDDLKNYKAKAEYFVRQHQDNEVIAKLKSNKPLTSADIKILEEILWSEVGTKQDYEAEYGEKPLGEFVREIVGLDMAAAKEAFAEYLDETNLNSRQIYFVNQIVEFIVHNGMMKDLSVLQEAPFTDQGSIVEVFTDLSVWMGIRRVIEQVNANALAA